MAVEIDTWTELAAMSSGLDGDYILTGNLGTGDGDYPSTWTPIGGYSGTPFTGTFDGQDYTIDGLTINTSNDYQGLFGYTSGATIYNLNLTNISLQVGGYSGGLVGRTAGVSKVSGVTVTGSIDADDYCGGIIGYSSTSVTILNCDVDLTYFEVDSGNNAGGIIGYTTGSGYVSGCVANVDNLYTAYYSSGDIGGLVGYSSGLVIEDCHTSGAITGVAYSDDNIGGLVGYLSNSVMKKCYSSMSVTNQGDHIGGAVGNTYGSVIEDCYSTGNVTHTYTSIGYRVGGFVGYIAQTQIINCYSTGDASGYVGNVGGFVGEVSSGIIMNCYAWGSAVNTGTNAGGFVGTNAGTIKDCYSTGSASAVTLSGGFDAVNTGTITNCFWDTTTSGNATSTSGTGRTTTQMQTLSNFSSIWAIVDIDSANLVRPPFWSMDDGSTYPILNVGNILGAIEGNVTLSGSPLSGAKITAIDSSNNFVENYATSDGSGDYSIPVRAGTYNVVCEYESGGVYYTDESKPNVVVS